MRSVTSAPPSRRRVIAAVTIASLATGGTMAANAIDTAQLVSTAQAAIGLATSLNDKGYVTIDDPYAVLQDGLGLSNTVLKILNNDTLGSITSLDELPLDEVQAAINALNSIPNSGLGVVETLADIVSPGIMQTVPGLDPINGAVIFPTSGRFTSPYGPRWGTFHEGIDIGNNMGTPILAAMSGTVIDAGPASGYGNWVRLQHSDGTITVYGHMKTILVSVGETVNAGTPIALMGSEGHSTGPHLHFEVHPAGGGPVDPVPWFAARGITVK
ncbi:MAG: M23 family metallopeptidase [Corynebacterium sp.]|nr:M23 family metallopeptidase [Corynebacterium sp.]